MPGQKYFGLMFAPKSTVKAGNRIFIERLMKIDLKNTKFRQSLTSMNQGKDHDVLQKGIN